jgi:hypothetical protein
MEREVGLCIDKKSLFSRYRTVENMECSRERKSRWATKGIIRTTTLFSPTRLTVRKAHSQEREGLDSKFSAINRVINFSSAREYKQGPWNRRAI